MTMFFPSLLRSPFLCPPCLCFSKTYFFWPCGVPQGPFFSQNSYLRKIEQISFPFLNSLCLCFPKISFYSLYFLCFFYREITSISPLIVKRVFHMGNAHVFRKLVSGPYRIVSSLYRFSKHPIYDRHGNLFARKKKDPSL